MTIKYSDPAIVVTPLVATDKWAATRDPTGAPSTIGTNAQGVLDFVEAQTTLLQKLSEKGAANGYASLDGSTLVPVAQIPTIDHTTGLSNVGTNTHAQIDTHIADTANPHGTDIGNLGSGTLAELNSAVTDATLIDTTDSRLSDARTPTAHATSHTDGTDDIQDATAAQKGLATAAQISKLDGIEAGADVTDATNVDAAGATMNSDTSLVGNGWFLDEDNMVSDDATKVPSQQSVKAYVDASATPPGGVDTEIQFNNAGAFGGAPMTTDGTDVTVPSPAKLNIGALNTGDNILTTAATTGEVQESGAKIETAPSGGSGIAVVEYAVAPVSPPTGFLWIQAKDASTKTLSYFDGTSTFSVDLSL